MLAHEGAHATRRDPLRLSLLRFLACLLFWVPALRRLTQDVADEMEIAADRAAAALHPLALATAILALARGPVERPPAGSVGFRRDDLLERRVRLLAGEQAGSSSHVTRRSLVGAGAMLLLVWLSGAMMLHPLDTGHTEHCVHQHTFAFMHLFCPHAQSPHPGAHCSDRSAVQPPPGSSFNE